MLKPKVLVVGSWGRPVHWTENAVEAFKQADCSVDHFAINGNSGPHALYLKLWRKLAGDDQAQIATSLRHKLRSFQPDLVVFILGAWLSDLPFQAVAETCPKAIKIAWVGDLFDDNPGCFCQIYGLGVLFRHLFYRIDAR